MKAHTVIALGAVSLISPMADDSRPNQFYERGEVGLDASGVGTQTGGTGIDGIPNKELGGGI